MKNIVLHYCLLIECPETNRHDALEFTTEKHTHENAYEI